MLESRCAPVDSRLDDLMLRRCLPRRRIDRIRRPEDLPPRLERLVRVVPADFAWRAYTDGASLWFAVGRRWKGDRESSRTDALEVYFFDADAGIVAGGVWEASSGRGWQLYRVIDIAAIETASVFFAPPPIAAAAGRSAPEPAALNNIDVYLH